ncbi:MAG TPA: TonB family protein [bacterium]|jgi:protein TonB
MNDHKAMYPIYFRLSLLSGIVMVTLLFIFIPYTEPEPYKLTKDIVTLVEAITVEIDQYVDPPKIDRPPVAVEAQTGLPDENIVETITNTNFIEDIIRTTPVDPVIDVVPYYKVEVKPQPLNNPIPRYPELAIKAGIEGMTVVKMLVDVDGSIVDVQVLKSSGNTMLDEAAIRAAKESRFTPAKQRDQCVRVWVSRPFKFALTSG